MYPQPPNYDDGVDRAPMHHHVSPPQPVPQPSNVVIVNANVPLGKDPQRLQCPYCQADIVTRVDHRANTKTHLIALALAIIQCWPIVCCLYCCECASCKRTDHYCPKCSRMIGSCDD